MLQTEEEEFGGGEDFKNCLPLSQETGSLSVEHIRNASVPYC